MLPDIVQAYQTKRLGDRDSVCDSDGTRCTWTSSQRYVIPRTESYACHKTSTYLLARFSCFSPRVRLVVSRVANGEPVVALHADSIASPSAPGRFASPSHLFIVALFLSAIMPPFPYFHIIDKNLIFGKGNHSERVKKKIMVKYVLFLNIIYHVNFFKTACIK